MESDEEEEGGVPWKCRALYDFVAQEPTDLAFAAGDIVVLLEARLGLGRIVALGYRSSTSIFFAKIFGASISETTMPPNPRHARTKIGGTATSRRRRT